MLPRIVKENWVKWALGLLLTALGVVSLKAMDAAYDADKRSDTNRALLMRIEEQQRMIMRGMEVIWSDIQQIKKVSERVGASIH